MGVGCGNKLSIVDNHAKKDFEKTEKCQPLCFSFDGWGGGGGGVQGARC